MSMRKKKKGENNQWDEKKGGKNYLYFLPLVNFRMGTTYVEIITNNGLI